MRTIVLLCVLVFASDVLDLTSASLLDEKLVELHRLSYPAFADCDICLSFVTLGDSLLAMNATLYEMEKPFIDFCQTFIFPNSEHPMCPGLIHVYAPSIVYVLEHTLLSAQEVCEQLHYCTATFAGAHRLDMSIPANDVFPSLPKRTSGLKPPIRMLQLSDLHFDPEYVPGTVADCGDVLCCRAEDVRGTRLAGPYGDYNCDVPIDTVHSMLQFIKKMPDHIDFVLWSGDNPPHDMWQETPQTQLNSSLSVTNIMKLYFDSTPVFPCFGNHEGYPANLYYQPKDSWLTNGLADMWAEWLSPDADRTFRNAGFYSMLVQPGVRVLAINSQFGYLFNWYTLLPDGKALAQQQFDFMVDTLEAARQAGEKILIHAHIPMGRWDTLPWWADQYWQIISNYSDIVVGQFSGHVHTDTFEVMRDFKSGTVPIGVVYIAPSVTTFWNINPSFRIFELDADTWEVLNYYQYHLNITQANLDGIASWELYYDAKSMYSISDCSAASWQEVSDRLLIDEQLASRYQNLQFTGTFGEQPCNDLCRLVSHCETNAASFSVYNQCLGVPTS